MTDGKILGSPEMFRGATLVHGSAAPVLDDAEPVHDEVVPAPAPAAPVEARRAPWAGWRRRRPVEPHRREQRAVRRRDRRRRIADAVVVHGTRTAVGGWVLVRGTGLGVVRWAWQPEIAALVAELAETPGAAGEALRRRRELSRYRRRRVGALTVGVLVVGGATRLPVDLVPTVPWWLWVGSGAAAVGGSWLAGRPEPDSDPITVAREQMPRTLTAGMSQRAVLSSVAEAFAAAKVDGVPTGAQLARTVPAWGWEVTAQILSPIGEHTVSQLERLLDTPVGGVLFGSVPGSARSRTIRLVMVDLLDQGRIADPIRQLRPGQLAPLAPRFDGQMMHVSLAGVHVLLIGGTGSGKSTALHRLFEIDMVSGAVIGGVDLTGGPDLRGWETAMHPSLRSFTPGDTAGAERVLARFVAIAEERKRRTAPGTRWRSTPADPPLRLYVDEYARVAQYPALREMVDFLAFYGRGVDVVLRLGSQRVVARFMGNNDVASQVQVKIYMGMDADDVKPMSRSLKADGVRPDRFVRAHLDEPNDAGKAYVTGFGTPVLVRFSLYPDGEPGRRASEFVAANGGPTKLGAHDELVLTSQMSRAAAVPPLLAAAERAILAVSQGRTPARASSSEIAEHMSRAGHDVTAANVTQHIRRTLGDAYPTDRRPDMNLPGGNAKGWYLDDLRRGIDRWLADHKHHSVTAPEGDRP